MGLREEKSREEKKKEEIPPNPQRGDGGELIACQAFVSEWNLTPGTVSCRSVTNKRVRAFTARIRDPAWAWRDALAKFPLRCFGESDDWKPDIDWFLKPDSVLKIIEGKYDWEKSNGSGNNADQRPTKFDANIATIADWAKNRGDGQGVCESDRESVCVEANN